MPRRVRTAKKLAQRIDLHYFKRPNFLRRWRLWLSVVFCSLALVWLGWQTAAGKQAVYSGGPVASAHAVFEDRCALCHVSTAGEFWQPVTDTACLSCHDGPLHQENQTFTPSCASCHLEHRGLRRLAHTRDAACTQCHASLTVQSGSPSVARSVSGFDRGHPEFRPLTAEGAGDPGQIKLNHAVHLEPDLEGPDGPVQMVCQDCHRTPAATGAWPYGTGEFQTVSSPSEERIDPLRPRPVAAYMAPMEYEKQCAACHELQFDPRFAEPVPHEKPEEVQRFVRAKFRDYIARHPEELRVESSRVRRLPGQPQPARTRVLTREQWVAERMREAERLLWHKTCKQCHALDFSEGGPPKVAEPSLPVRWLPRARFDHEAHRMLACASCHAAASSRETADVLLPGIENCRQCHQQSTQRGAEGRCFECHEYHDWRRQKRVKGTMKLSDLVRP